MKLLGYQHCISNINGKIWFFWTRNCQTSIIDNNDQQITIKMLYGTANNEMYITVVYTKCIAAERKELWSSLEGVHLVVNGPWSIRGDFNVILDPDEKRGGNPHRMHRSFDFINCMDNCEVTDLGFVGPRFTWCNNQKPRKKIWKRLDRVFINDQWTQLF